MDFLVHPIGTIGAKDGCFCLRIDKEYRAALAGLEGFGHLQAIWWFDGCDGARARSRLVEARPYARGPERMGAFATRSPCRPNPIALTCAGIVRIDWEGGVIDLDYIDAEDGSPLLDIKPYTPSLDRVERPIVSAWCAHWPQSVEESGDFDWAGEFTR